MSRQVMRLGQKVYAVKRELYLTNVEYEALSEIAERHGLSLGEAAGLAIRTMREIVLRNDAAHERAK